MAIINQPAKQSDFITGMISDVNENIVPPNSVQVAVNLDFDNVLGSAVSRLGTSLVGSQLVDNKSILGLHQYIDPANANNNVLFAVVNVANDATATIKNVASGADVVTGLTASTKMRFLTYGGDTLAINGVDADRAWNSSAWVTTGSVFDLDDFPANCKIAIEYLDRIYTSGDATYPSRVYYSTLFDGSTITWAGDYIDIEPEDQGGRMTAFAKVPGYILFFKERSMHRWNFSSAFPETLVQIGTPSQESVVQSGGLVFFYSNSDDDARGFYVTNGGRPQCISKDTTRTIKKFVDAIATANEANIAGGSTDRIVWWSVGDLTVDGETYNNVVFRYNRILNQWSIRTYPTEFKVFASYLVSGVNTRIGGDDDGNILKFDASGVYTDNGSDINWMLRTHNENFGTNRLKTLSDKIIVRGKNLEGMITNVIPDEDLTRRVTLTKNNWLRKILSFLKVGDVIKGTTIATELKGSQTGNQAHIKEIEIVGLDIADNYES